ncbi:hypothetical protein C3F00_012495 [Pseudomonas sp. MWU13-2860]|nr:hypothetical protein C3F00_012495 [Pseudomonas sp. MWU13-2860]
MNARQLNAICRILARGPIQQTAPSEIPLRSRRVIAKVIAHGISAHLSILIIFVTEHLGELAALFFTPASGHMTDITG